MLPMLENELTLKAKYLTKDEILLSFSMAQTLPGVIGSNAAAIIGFQIKGIPGALVSTLGMITPSVLIILGISLIMQQISSIQMVENAFSAIRIAVLALLIDSLIKLSRVAVFDKKTLMIAIGAFFLILMNFLSPLTVILIGAGLGFWIYRERIGS